MRQHNESRLIEGSLTSNSLDHQSYEIKRDEDDRICSQDQWPGLEIIVRSTYTIWDSDGCTVVQASVLFSPG
jgi:hypothetical protein